MSRPGCQWKAVRCSWKALRRPGTPSASAASDRLKGPAPTPSRSRGGVRGPGVIGFLPQDSCASATSWRTSWRQPFRRRGAGTAGGGRLSPSSAAAARSAASATRSSSGSRSALAAAGCSNVALSQSRRLPSPSSATARPRTARPSMSSVRRTSATTASPASGSRSSATTGRNSTVLIPIAPGRRRSAGRASTARPNSSAVRTQCSTSSLSPRRPSARKVTAIFRASGRRVVRNGAAEQVGEPGLGVVVGVEVVGAQGQRGEQGGVRDGEHSGGDRLPAEFVQVERYGDGPVEPREPGRQALAEQQGPAVRRVDVELGAVPSPRSGRSRGAGRCAPRRWFRRWRRPGPVRRRARSRVRSRAAGSMRPSWQATTVGAGRPSIQAARCTLWWALAPVTRARVRLRPVPRRPFAGEEQGDEVGLGAAAGDEGVGRGGVRVDEPGQCGGGQLLDDPGGGRLVPGVHRRVECGPRQLRRGRHRQRRAVQMGDARGVGRVGGPLGDGPYQVRERGLAADALIGQHRCGQGGGPPGHLVRSSGGQRSAPGPGGGLQGVQDDRGQGAQTAGSVDAARERGSRTGAHAARRTGSSADSRP